MDEMSRREDNIKMVVNEIKWEVRPNLSGLVQGQEVSCCE